MNDLDDNSRETAEARSRRLHAEFEAYYAEWERRRLGQEAFARRKVHLHLQASRCGDQDLA